MDVIKEQIAEKEKVLAAVRQEITKAQNQLNTLTTQSIALQGAIAALKECEGKSGAIIETPDQTAETTEPPDVDGDGPN